MVSHKAAWSREEALQLIKEYKKHPILYNVTHEDHIKINKRNDAWNDILYKVKGIKPNATIAGLKKKIKVLNHQIGEEKKKMAMAASLRREKSDVGDYRPTLWCFKELSFLLHANDECKEEPTCIIHEEEESDTDEDESMINEQSSSSSNKKIKASRRPELDLKTYNQSVANSFETIQSKKTKITNPQLRENCKEDAFCELLSFELKALKLEESYDRVTTEILHIVRQAKMEERKLWFG